MLKLIMRLRQFHTILFLFIIIPCTANAVKIVRMDVQIGVNQYNLDLELYDSITPVTVTNFLKYADDGVGDFRYDNSFIHRSLPNFVIQGGGFTFDPALGDFDHSYDSVLDTHDYPGGLEEVPEYASIINEFTGSGLSNVRGTIAMAQVNTDPDSATSQWFINHVDNTFLDSDNYTVFGHVLGDGMAVVDQIAAVPVFNLSSVHAAYSTLPLDGYVNSDPVIQDNLVWLNSATVIQRPILKSDTDPIDFAFVMLGATTQKTIILRNTGNADLVMDGASLAALSAPFSIVTETCSNNTLSPESENPSDTCSVTIEFSPDTVGDYQDNLVITPSVNPLSISESLAVKGAGSLTGESDLDADGVVDTEEQNSPNNGDANFDNLQDNVQDYVASFLTNKGVYANIITEAAGSFLKKVAISPNPSPDNMPKNANF
ncbi:MAG: peptidylprolyl isomerase, partial [Gammaproteobacteria bacterium]|nr:peptidylprolyl isomerase [Gammaproteobacteria bacterium]